MCKAACKKHCDNEAIGIKCAGMDCLGLERTAQHAPAVKIPVGMRGSPKPDHVDSMDVGGSVWPHIQAAHESSRRQNAMHEACAIASALAGESRKTDDPEPLAALMRHVGTQEHATLQLLKLVGRIGLRNWFDGDFLVLTIDEARKVADQIDSRGIGSACIAMMNHKIGQAKA